MMKAEMKRIPIGMHRPVERSNTPQKRHPVRDAPEGTSGYFLPGDTSLTGCQKTYKGWSDAISHCVTNDKFQIPNAAQRSEGTPS
jgi:hypothetical protein